MSTNIAVELWIIYSCFFCLPCNCKWLWHKQSMSRPTKPHSHGELVYMAGGGWSFRQCVNRLWTDVSWQFSKKSAQSFLGNMFHSEKASLSKQSFWWRKSKSVMCAVKLFTPSFVPPYSHSSQADLVVCFDNFSLPSNLQLVAKRGDVYFWEKSLAKLLWLLVECSSLLAKILL